MSKILFTSAIICVVIAASFTNADAYRLPPYKITPEQNAAPAEESLAFYQGQLQTIRSNTSPVILSDYRHNYKSRPTNREQSFISRYEDTQQSISFWNSVVDLKRHLTELHAGKSDPKVNSEADAMAKIIVQRIYDLSQEYRVSTSALFNNLLITTGFKKRGYCYHYVNDIRKTLSERPWHFFEVHWGEAWGGSILENNGLVITAKDAPFESGIAIDAWRTAGRPYWNSVATDHYPWKEAKNVSDVY